MINPPALLRYQNPLFELRLQIKVQKAGFKNREDGALLAEGGNANVRYWYMRTYNVSARNIHRKHMLDFPSSLHIRCRITIEANHRYQSPLFELHLQIKVQKAGFKNREDGALLAEGGNVNVRYWYMRTYNVSARNIHRKHMLDFPSSLHIRF